MPSRLPWNIAVQAPLFPPSLQQPTMGYPARQQLTQHTYAGQPTYPGQPGYSSQPSYPTQQAMASIRPLQSGVLPVTGSAYSSQQVAYQQPLSNVPASTFQGQASSIVGAASGLDPYQQDEVSQSYTELDEPVYSKSQPPAYTKSRPPPRTYDDDDDDDDYDLDNDIASSEAEEEDSDEAYRPYASKKKGKKKKKSATVTKTWHVGRVAKRTAASASEESDDGAWRPGLEGRGKKKGKKSKKPKAQADSEDEVSEPDAEIGFTKEDLRAHKAYKAQQVWGREQGCGYLGLMAWCGRRPCPTLWTW